ncbi:MAG: SMI1/KNR4 family protein [Spirochaetales bacterium]
MTQHNLWGSNHYGHPDLTDGDIVSARQQLGRTLPEEYLNLLRVQNGGYTRGLVFPTAQPTSWADDHVPLEWLAGIVLNPSITTPFNLLESPRLSELWGLPEHQLLLSGEGHWWITLDYRHGANPVVSWIDVESNEDIELAASFGAFLDALEVAEQ